MPANLADLPSNQPIPNARCQFKTGIWNGQTNVTNTISNIQIPDDGLGNSFMEISYTPRYPCLWVVRSNSIWCGISGGWQRVDHTIQINPADADGQVVGGQTIAEVYDNTTVGWCPFPCHAAFRLNAGIAYKAYMAFGYSSGGVQALYYGPEYLRLMGRVVGEGVI